MQCKAASSAKSVEDVLTLKQVSNVVRRRVGEGWRVAGGEVRPASAGLSGFLGDHHRVTLRVAREDCLKTINIFVKSMPTTNEPKAKFIDENNFYRREVLMYDLFEKMAIPDEPEPWYVKAYICSDNIVVMPDLLHQGYRQRPPLAVLDLKHTLLTTTSLARFHAAFANYETNELRNGWSIGREHANLLTEPTFRDSPWLRAAAKLSRNVLKAFSEEWNQYPANLEETLVKLYIEACATLTESDSLNVIIHKDLWVNNIMFKYDGESPTSALIIDFQCIRYGPPAFDLMIFLYLNTSRSFREKYESMLFRQYFLIFMENVDDSTKERLRILGYDNNEFVSWCNNARMFGMLEALAIFPFVLMDPAAAQRTFDDPETYEKYCDEDRSAPVLAHAAHCQAYKERLLEVNEEFIERYVLKQL